MDYIQKKHIINILFSVILGMLCLQNTKKTKHWGICEMDLKRI